jgi:diaminohydroxyphosphoribosylaminopyrimidine deaminase/5-amino-6-(5-phosphoribosylamino)uracil reductase
MTELEAMEHALALAMKGWGRVHPNPMVGAVVLQDSLPVAEAYHAEFGGSHAERAALESAGARAQGATVVVTLEPCAHRGKQPPCVDALIAAGVRRVVAAAGDPNPIARGGAEALREAGIDVEIGLLADAARRQNAAFFHRFGGNQRPWVALKLATSLDFRIADAEGRSQWISGPEARAFVHGLRAGFEAIAVGGRTATLDDPSLTARGTVPPRLPSRRVIFAGHAPVPDTLRLVRTAHDVPTTVVVPLASAEACRERLIDAGVDCLPAESPAEALEALWGEGVVSVLVEGGGKLAGSLLAAGLVDRFYWIQAPLWLGSRGTPAVSGWDVASLDSAERWTVVDHQRLGEDALLILDRA